MDKEPFSLGRIWQLQKLTDPMRAVIRAGLTVVNDYLRTGGTATTTPAEWAKKIECWTNLQIRPVSSALQAAINALPAVDRAPDVERPRQKKADKKVAEKELAHEEERTRAGALTSLGMSAWAAIESWGRETQLLTPRQIEISRVIMQVINMPRTLSRSEIDNGHLAIDAVIMHSPDLLLEVENAEVPVTVVADDHIPTPLTSELLRNIYDWERSVKRLTDFQFNMIRKMVKEERMPRPSEEKLIREIVEMAMGQGFQLSSPV